MSLTVTSRYVVLLCLIAGLPAVAAPPAVAEAPPATWTGTIAISTDFVIADYPYGYTRFEQTATATLTGLVPLPVYQAGEWVPYGAASADVAVDEKYLSFDGENPCIDGRAKWEFNGPLVNAINHYPPHGIAVELRTDRDGRTSLWPRSFHGGRGLFYPSNPDRCGDGQGSQSPDSAALSYYPLEGPAPYEGVYTYRRPISPLVDTDPDPRRLVGTTVYDIGNIPNGGGVHNFLKYNYTVTYDLTRVPIVADTGTNPDPSPKRPTLDPSPERPTLTDRYCKGTGAAGFAIDVANLTQKTPLRALGPVGTGLSVVGAVCNFGDLPGVETATATAATSACAGLTTFSTGVGIGSLGLAATGVGLGPAVIGGGISFFTGLIAQVPCSFTPPSSSSFRVARTSIAAGPDDYRRPVRAAPIRLRVAGTKVLPPRVRKPWIELWTNVGTNLGYARAMWLAQSRAEAAAAAGDVEWSSRHYRAAAGFASSAAATVRKQVILQRRLKAALGPRLAGARFDHRAIRRGLKRLPSAVVVQLRRLGASGREVADLRRRTATRAKGAPIPKTLGEALTGRQTTRALRSTAAAIDGLARALRRRAA